MRDKDCIRLSTRASLALIGGALFALGLFLYFIKLAVDEALRLAIGTW